MHLPALSILVVLTFSGVASAHPSLAAPAIGGGGEQNSETNLRADSDRAALTIDGLTFNQVAVVNLAQPREPSLVRYIGPTVSRAAVGGGSVSLWPALVTLLALRRREQEQAQRQRRRSSRSRPGEDRSPTVSTTTADSRHQLRN